MSQEETITTLEAMSQDEDQHPGDNIITVPGEQPSTYIVHHVTQNQIDEMSDLEIHHADGQGNIVMGGYIELKESDSNKSNKAKLSRQTSRTLRKSHSMSPNGQKSNFKPKVFNDAWLLSHSFKEWLERHPHSNLKAICKVCNKVLLAGKSELLKHGLSKKHRKFMAATLPWTNNNKSMDGDFPDPDSNDECKDTMIQDLNFFQDSWLEDPLFSGWLSSHPDTPCKALCKACNQVLLASKVELTKHRLTKKHRLNLGSMEMISSTNDEIQVPEDARLDQSRDFSIEESESVDQTEGSQVYDEYTELPHRMYKVVPNDQPTSTTGTPSKKEEIQVCVTKPAPFWKGKAVVNGHVTEMKLSDYRGRYLVMFFYPQDFSTVCSTEILALADIISAFRVINCEVIACSVDSHLAHLAWTKTLGARSDGTRIVPLLSDATHTISKSYGCFLPSDGHTLRAYYVIDKKGILRAMNISDVQVGRNLKEILRMVEAFQLVDSTDTQCPVNWTTGQPTVKVVF